MELEKLCQILEEAELLAVYRAYDADEILDYDDSLPLPFLKVYQDGVDPFVADDIVYYEKKIFYIELYTDIKDPVLERKIKNLLNKHGLIYKQYDRYWDEVKVHEVLWEIKT